MRIERGDHAADGLVHQRVIVDVIDVLTLDPLINFSEQPRFFPWQGSSRLRSSLGRFARVFREHTAGQCGGKPKDSPRDESDQRSRSRRHHFLKPPGLDASRILQPSLMGQSQTGCLLGSARSNCPS